MKTYQTAQAAAIAALAVAAPLARRDAWEYGGWIVKNGSGFSFLEPVTSEKPHAVNMLESMEDFLGVEFDVDNAQPMVRALRSAEVITSYHTHLCWDGDVQGVKETYDDYSAAWFSVQDMFLEQELQQHPSYIGIPCSGNVYASPREPQITKTDILMVRLFGIDPPGFRTTGKLVGNIYRV